MPWCRSDCVGILLARLFNSVSQNARVILYTIRRHSDDPQAFEAGYALLALLDDSLDEQIALAEELLSNDSSNHLAITTWIDAVVALHGDDASSLIAQRQRLMVLNIRSMRGLASAGAFFKYRRTLKARTGIVRSRR